MVKNNRLPLEFGAARLLADRFRVFQIHPVGFGASDRPAEYDFGDIGAQLVAVMDREGVDRFVVWGFSQCAAMAAMAARSTKRVVALVAGGFQLLDTPTPGTMRRLEREPRLPWCALTFWRAFSALDWVQELRAMGLPKLLYIGTADPAYPRMHRYAPALRYCGCDILEFEGLDHTTAGLAAQSAGCAGTTGAVADWLAEKLPAGW